MVLKFHLRYRGPRLCEETASVFESFLLILCPASACSPSFLLSLILLHCLTHLLCHSWLLTILCDLFDSFFTIDPAGASQSLLNSSHTLAG